MLEKRKRYRTSIWRVPLIAIIAGFFYQPIYIRIALTFGIDEFGVVDDGVTLMTSAGILLAVLLLGGILLLRKQSRKEIFVSAAIVSIYGILLLLIQLLLGAVTGPAALIFIYLSKPLEWTGFFPQLSFYLQNHYGVSLSVIGWLRFFAPLLFVLFGQRELSENG